MIAIGDWEDRDTIAGRAAARLMALSIFLSEHGSGDKKLRHTKGEHLLRRPVVIARWLLGRRASHEGRDDGLAANLGVSANEAAHIGRSVDCDSRRDSEWIRSADRTLLGKDRTAGTPQRQMCAGGVPNQRDTRQIDRVLLCECAQVIDAGTDVKKGSGPSGAGSPTCRYSIFHVATPTSVSAEASGAVFLSVANPTVQQPP